MDVDNMRTVVDTATKAAAPTELFRGTDRVVISTAARGVETVDLSPTLPAPLRKRGTVKVFDAASMNQIIADNSDAGNIAIYIDRHPINPAVVAVLNGHGKGGAGWSDFRVTIEFRPTPQWKKWTAIDGKMLDQEDFAEFIEDNLDDVATPPKADFLDIVTYLQATRTVNFRSGVRLASGAIQFEHAEDVQAKVGPGSVAVPSEFTLGIAPVFGMPSYEVPVRFRYRLRDGTLTLGIKLQRVETMMARILEDVVQKIEKGANISVLDGLPPS
jgi:uncharacterized protein YfdQ (DUF2303 family)